MITVGEALRNATTRLGSVGRDSPPQEARWLLGHLLQKSSTWLTLHSRDLICPRAASHFESMVLQRLGGEPLSYILGEAEFYGRRFVVDRRVLVPRPETEELLELAIGFARDCEALPDRLIRIADVGTGSGILAVSLALELPSASIVGYDTSEPALAIARLNVKRHQVERQVTLVRSDLLAAIEAPIDVLVANLPYVRSGALPDLQPEVLREPLLALDGGTDGFDLYRRLFRQAAALVPRPAGMFFEIGSDQGVIARLVGDEFFPERQVEIIQDLAGHDRFVVVTH